ncbi:hypothetical protein [Streptomyces sp. SP2-10]|uniref:hypothetical protein n=1 Tax=Streptomyces sp. SP2-10 TaxID=2873385 RepID=UPI001CA6B826|nr:hypothetical protein [Streptomyces sp. SP2-10]MBY8847057.1 hypothetical protein [Streptomyces sp. SP2-10]
MPGRRHQHELTGGGAESPDAATSTPTDGGYVDGAAGMSRPAAGVWAAPRA